MSSRDPYYLSTFSLMKQWERWGVVVAQLTEQLLPTPEICGSNPVIGSFFTELVFNVSCCTVKKKRSVSIFKYFFHRWEWSILAIVVLLACDIYWDRLFWLEKTCSTSTIFIFDLSQDQKQFVTVNKFFTKWSSLPCQQGYIDRRLGIYSASCFKPMEF